MKTKKVLYSYLLGEKDLARAISDTNDGGTSYPLHRTIKSAVDSRKMDCYDGTYKPGPLVKITLEIVKE